jgi:hypothetical protein
MGLFGRKSAIGQSIRAYKKTKRVLTGQPKKAPAKGSPRVRSRPSESLPAALGREERAVETYRRQVRAVLRTQGPQSREWKRLLRSAETSRDIDYLVQLRAGAEQIRDWGMAKDPHPQPVDAFIDDLVRTINARLRMLEGRS